MKVLIEFDWLKSMPFYITQTFWNLLCYYAATIVNRHNRLCFHLYQDWRKSFHPSQTKAEKLITKSLIRDLLFVDDASVMAHSLEDLQTLLDGLFKVFSDFGLTTRFDRNQSSGARCFRAFNHQDQRHTAWSRLWKLYLARISVMIKPWRGEIDWRILEACSTLSW